MISLSRLEKVRSWGSWGESGSGKSVTALSILGLIQEPPGLVSAKAISFKDPYKGELRLDTLSEERAAGRSGKIHFDDLSGADDFVESLYLPVVIKCLKRSASILISPGKRPNKKYSSFLKRFAFQILRLFSKHIRTSFQADKNSG